MAVELRESAVKLDSSGNLGQSLWLELENLQEGVMGAITREPARPGHLEPESSIVERVSDEKDRAPTLGRTSFEPGSDESRADAPALMLGMYGHRRELGRGSRQLRGEGYRREEYVADDLALANRDQ